MDQKEESKPQQDAAAERMIKEIQKCQQLLNEFWPQRGSHKEDSYKIVYNDLDQKIKVLEDQIKYG